eukprot:TRINITY_DN3187_c0_g1_i2.p1 TRINITY_DN3187_c0_g1~~TRINITY_DN3187_c0_g1_i2.p1  ORF type:complete len:230 (+),score=42.14 TRINITY_DN3187_c0_g1_i2:95-784(+)
MGKSLMKGRETRTDRASFSFTSEQDELSLSMLSLGRHSKSTVLPRSRDVRRFVVIGANDVGKTAFVWKVTKGLFREDYTPNLEERHKLSLQLKGGDVEDVCLIDTPGVDRYTAVNPYVLSNGVSGYILVYSTTNRDSFNTIPFLRRKLFDYNGRHLPCVLVATKSDLSRGRNVSKDEGQLLASVWGIPFFEVSISRDSRESLKRIVARTVKVAKRAENPKSSFTSYTLT